MTYKISPHIDATVASTPAVVLMHHSGIVCLGDKMVCLATRLASGYWVTCYDLVFGINRGRCEVPPADLTILHHGVHYPVRWSVDLALEPMLLMHVEQDNLPAVGATAPMSEYLVGPILQLWRIGYSDAWWKKTPAWDAPIIFDGVTISGECQCQFFRSASDPMSERNAPNVHCQFNEPQRSDYGAPVVLNDGRVAGVLIGGQFDDQTRARGAFMPVEFIMPFVNLWKARRESDTSGWPSGYFYRVHGL
jgi:hypothetical protein